MGVVSGRFICCVLHIMSSSFSLLKSTIITGVWQGEWIVGWLPEAAESKGWQN
jgi:hypothetical protein